MAGPVAQVLFATAAAASWQATLDDIVASVRVGDRARDRFRVGTTRPIGGSYEGEGRPFVVSVGTELPWDIREPDEIAATPAFYEAPFGVL